MIKPFAIDLMPAGLNRNISPHALPGSLARILQAVDPTYFIGRIVRGKGCARTQLAGSATTITNIFTATRPDCRRMVMDNSTAGVIRLTIGQGDCSGPLPEWDDCNVDEETGVECGYV